MTKTTLYSPTEKIYPPGKCIQTESKSKLTLKPIRFPENNSKIPFAPIVQATIMIDGTFQIRAVFLVARKPKGQGEDEKKDELKFDIYQNWYVDLRGQRQLQFFIAYDIDDSIEENFDVYEASFKAEKDPYGEKAFADIATIQTFLWDIDPETSRGTETTVQQGTGGGY
ncbi:hypothetical protein [Flavobacterium sp. N1736]|uniref:hypothetical protein n=1 Tax=Flavobacterium sp. N1736 TaxID=2986823 RepID=UPI0022259104|nr:hypothetical protein [Flavobacterium sp. N1736]